MTFTKIKSHAKLNLALNITGKTSSLHKIESIVAFVDLHDEILIKKTKSQKHNISFKGKFSNNISKNNTIHKLLKFFANPELLNNKKFHIKIDKKIPSKAGLGGGARNAARIVNDFVK